MFNVLFLQLQLVLSQITTPNPVQVQTQERLLINQEPCGDNPENTYFISKDTEFIQISNCPVVNSSIFINGEFDITSLTPMENISTIHGDLVIQDSHTIYNLKGLENLRTIISDDLYMDRYALYINNNENLGFVNNVNWTKVVGNRDTFLNINNDLNYLECYNQCDGCYGPGPYLCQSCVNYTFYDNNTCTDTCDTVLYDSVCQVRPPNNLFIDYLTGYSYLYLDWGSDDIYSDLIDGYYLYHNDIQVLSTTINDNAYYFNQTDLVISHIMTNLIPGTSFNCSIVAHSKFGFSQPHVLNINLPEYIPENFTGFYYNNSYENDKVELYWNPIILPDELFFMENDLIISYEYYLDNYNISGISYDTSINFYDLEYGAHEIFIKPIVQVEYNNQTLYFSGDYQSRVFHSIFTTTTETTTTTTTTTITQSTTPSSPHNLPIPTPDINNSSEDALIALYVFLAILGLAIVIVGYICYKNNKKRELLKKMKDDKIVQFSNPAYETTPYAIGDTESTSSFRNAQVNPIYQNNHEDPDKDYYTI